jgi:hypothetical protein
MRSGATVVGNLKAKPVTAASLDGHAAMSLRLIVSVVAAPPSEVSAVAATTIDGERPGDPQPEPASTGTWRAHGEQPDIRRRLIGLWMSSEARNKKSHQPSDTDR